MARRCASLTAPGDEGVAEGGRGAEGAGRAASAAAWRTDARSAATAAASCEGDRLCAAARPPSSAAAGGGVAVPLLGAALLEAPVAGAIDTGADAAREGGHSSIMWS